jgi:hypothetical protein
LKKKKKKGAKVPALNPVEQQHMLNLYGVRFNFRCDNCRRGIDDVLNGYKARVLGGSTLCTDCKATVELGPKDTVEFIPKEVKLSFMGKKDDPEVPESWSLCGDCGKKLSPTVSNLAHCYIVTVNKSKKAVCHDCYHDKYDHGPTPRRGAISATAPVGSTDKVETKILKLIGADPKRKWNVGILFAELTNEHKPTIREAVRVLKRNGTLYVEAHALKIKKGKTQ